MQILYHLAEVMVAVILAAVAIEALLYAVLFLQLRSRARTLLDSLKNMLKGVASAPEHDHARAVPDAIDAMLQVAARVKEQNRAEYSQMLANMRSQNVRMLDMKTFRAESLANLGAAMVQVFPLLGILGTVLAIAKSAAQSAASSAENGAVMAALDPGVVTASFALAMDTTILGILAGVIFMLVDSLAQTRVTRLIEESAAYRAFLEVDHAGGAL